MPTDAMWYYQQFISNVRVDNLYVLQETIPRIFTGQIFNSWAALSFNTSGLMDNKLACDRVVTNVSGNSSVCNTRLTGQLLVKEGNELHGTEHFQL